MIRVALEDAKAEVLLADFAMERLQDPWWLVFGGITKEGRYRAARACTTALEDRQVVVWFDGYFSAPAPSIILEEGEGLALVEFGDAERRTLAARLTNERTRLSEFALGRWLSRRLIRRLGTMVRPHRNWRLMRPAIRALSPAPGPSRIVYCDDFAVPAAWHASRSWPSAEVVAAIPAR